MLLHMLGKGADEYELDVEAQRGVVVRLEARHAGQAFHVREAVSLEFDLAIPAERFVFEPPPGESVATSAERVGALSAHVPLHEAATRMPFKVFVPERVPADWQLHIVAHGPSQRPPSPGFLGLQYRTPNGAAALGIAQSAKDSAMQPGYGPGTPGWRTVQRDGITMKLRERTTTWPQTQLTLEREDTHVALSSEALDADALITLAGSLRPAPTDPPRI